MPEACVVSAEKSMRAAVHERDLAGLLRALDSGANSKVPSFGEDTPLMRVCEMGWEAGVRALLPVSDVNWRNDLGSDALMRACQRDRAPALKALMESGCDLCLDAMGRTPLMSAALNGARDCVELLLPVSDPKAVDMFGHSALHWACANGSEAVVARLLPLSDLGAKNTMGVTARGLAHGVSNERIQAIFQAFEEAQALSATVAGAMRPKRVGL